MERQNKMTHPDLVPSFTGTSVAVGAGSISWFATHMSMLQGVSLIISIVAGALTIVYTLKKIFENK